MSIGSVMQSYLGNKPLTLTHMREALLVMSVNDLGLAVRQEESEQIAVLAREEWMRRFPLQWRHGKGWNSITHCKVYPEALANRPHFDADRT